MVKKTHAKRKRDIKTKLMAAICMLLVSSIMMVSTTYAWFTLSTAPEVTGINTAVGANGNLEMALLPTTGDTNDITTGVSDSTLEIERKNVTWGNLVDLGDSTVYGLDQITLYPAALNLTAAGKIDVAGYILKTPKYGADGRVSELVANAVTGYFNTQGDGAFYQNNNKGVRALGTVSGMTPRQLSYRNALSAGNTARGQAANKASAVLNANGSALANIAIEYGMGADTAKFDATDLAALRALIDGLNGTDGALKQIETAYMQYILAYAASKANTTGDDNGEAAWGAVELIVKASNAKLSSVTKALTDNDMTIPAEVQTGIEKYNAAAAQVAAADNALKALEESDDTEFKWEDIRAVMTPLADPAKIKVNGFLASQVKENLGALVSSVTAQGGLRVIMETGAGVFADIADQSADYTASVNIAKVQYGEIVLENMSARMETDSALTPNNYLVAVGTAVTAAGSPDGSSATAQPISDFFGYIVDLAFRTNATDSDLLLQTEATDRIYGDNTNEATMGHGSTMTFMATTTDFSNQQVKDLMDAIKIVFFNPDDGTIYCYGKLDTANATAGMDGITAKMSLQDSAGVAIADNVIMALNQNQATALSVLVYLDGNVVNNGDVAASGSTSMTGKMNLQFASSATLVPMEYADLHIPGEKTTYDVTLPAGVTGEAKATEGADYSFTVGTGYTLGTVTVGGTEVTPTAGQNGAYTIPKDKVTGAIVITATANP